MRAVASFSRTVREQLNHEDGTKVADIRNALILAHWEAQPYLGQKYVDLYDFCNLLKGLCSRHDLNSYCWMRIRAACQNVLNTIRGPQNEDDAKYADEKFQYQDDEEPVNFQTDPKGFVWKSCYSGPIVQYSYGVAIYFPWSEEHAKLDEYGEIFFCQDSEWIHFLFDYLRVTKREPRPGPKAIQNQADKLASQAFMQLAEIKSSTVNKSSMVTKAALLTKAVRLIRAAQSTKAAL